MISEDSQPALVMHAQPIQPLKFFLSRCSVVHKSRNNFRPQALEDSACQI